MNDGRPLEISETVDEHEDDSLLLESNVGI